ncbi:MAG: formate dehydrogenase accessory protein FdhE [Vicinamibacterales bacterium]
MASPPRPDRAVPRELAALDDLAARHPELAPAVALERELLDGERRLQRRLGTPWIDGSAEALAARLAGGECLIELDQLSLDWRELRLRLRQVVDVLRRHDVLDADQVPRLQALERGAELPEVVNRWFAAAPGRGGGDAGDAVLGDVLSLALRPFLARAADVLLQRVAVDAWGRSTCPLCGGRPTFAVLANGDRQLVCGRCQGRWPFDGRRCHHCLAEGVRVFSAHEGVYQVTACDACRRYLKGLDTRRAGRPFFLPLDTVATLALDQAIAERGYQAG